MKVCTVSALSLLIAVVVGCDVQDVLPTSEESQRLANAQRLSEQHWSEERDESGLSVDQRALSNHLAAVNKTLSDDLARNADERKQMSVDRELLLERIKASTQSDADERKTRVDVLLSVLDDDAVNSLAMRYLGHDFRMVRLAFEEEVQAALDSKRRRQTDEEKNAAEYDRALKDALATSDKAHQEALQAEKRLKKEIEALEQKQASLQKTLSFSAAFERKKRESELSAVAAQLQRLQRLYDVSGDRRATASDAQRISRQTEHEMDMANRRRKDGDERIRKIYANAKSVSSIVSRYEKDTVSALELAMSEQSRKMADAAKGLERVRSYVLTVAGGVDKLNPTALPRVKADVDSRVRECLTRR